MVVEAAATLRNANASASSVRRCLMLRLAQAVVTRPMSEDCYCAFCAFAIFFPPESAVAET